MKLFNTDLERWFNSYLTNPYSYNSAVSLVGYLLTGKAVVKSDIIKDDPHFYIIKMIVIIHSTSHINIHNGNLRSLNIKRKKIENSPLPFIIGIISTLKYVFACICVAINKT